MKPMRGGRRDSSQSVRPSNQNMSIINNNNNKTEKVRSKKVNSWRQQPQELLKKLQQRPAAPESYSLTLSTYGLYIVFFPCFNFKEEEGEEDEVRVGHIQLLFYLMVLTWRRKSVVAGAAAAGGGQAGEEVEWKAAAAMLTDHRLVQWPHLTVTTSNKLLHGTLTCQSSKQTESSSYE